MWAVKLVLWVLLTFPTQLSHNCKWRRCNFCFFFLTFSPDQWAPQPWEEVQCQRVPSTLLPPRQWERQEGKLRRSSQTETPGFLLWKRRQKPSSRSCLIRSWSCWSWPGTDASSSPLAHPAPRANRTPWCGTRFITRQNLALTWPVTATPTPTTWTTSWQSCRPRGLARTI